MNGTTAAVAVHFAPPHLRAAWSDTALTRAEREFMNNRGAEWEHINQYNNDFGMAVEWATDSDSRGQYGYDTEFKIVGSIDKSVLEQVEIKENVARQLTEAWVSHLYEVVEETQESTTLSAKEFATAILMEDTCSEQEAADALGVTVGTYRGKKGRISEKQDECENAAVFSRLLNQEFPIPWRHNRQIGLWENRVEATDPVGIYEAQLDAQYKPPARVQQGENPKWVQLKRISIPREEPADRDHETYEAGHWRTAHIEDIDRVFVTDSAPQADEAELRVDFDGIGHPGADMHRKGENVQVSAWLNETTARVLYEGLKEQFEDERGEVQK
jgi:hypothetical protein